MHFYRLKCFFFFYRSDYVQYGCLLQIIFYDVLLHKKEGKTHLPTSNLYHIYASRSQSNRSSRLTVPICKLMRRGSAIVRALCAPDRRCRPLPSTVSTVIRERRWRLHFASGAVHDFSRLASPAHPRARAPSSSTWTTLWWRPGERTVRLAARYGRIES